MATKRPAAAATKGRKLIKPASSESTTSTDIPAFDETDDIDTVSVEDSDVNEDVTEDAVNTTDDDDSEDEGDDDSDDDDPSDPDALDEDGGPVDPHQADGDPIEPDAEVKPEPYKEWMHDPSVPTDGVIIGPGEYIEVEGVRIGNFVTLTKPVYRALKQPNGTRWGYRLLYSQNAQVHHEKLHSYTSPEGQ